VGRIQAFLFVLLLRGTWSAWFFCRAKNHRKKKPVNLTAAMSREVRIVLRRIAAVKKRPDPPFSENGSGPVRKSSRGKRGVLKQNKS
jgi:hypothetical protein